MNQETNQMQNTLFIIDRMEGGGAERQMLKVANIAANNSKVHILSLHTPSPKLTNYAIEQGFVLIDKSIKTNSHLRYFLYLYLIFYLFFYKRINKINKCISFLEVSNIINILSISPKKSILIINVRNHLSSQYSYSKIKKIISQYFLSYFYNIADKIVCNSEAIKIDLQKSFNIKKDSIEVIYNIYDIDDIRRKSSIYIENPFENILFGKKFLFCGRLSPQKGLDNLISTFLSHLEHNKNDQLLIIGSGNLPPQQSKLIEKANGKIILLGHKNNPYPYFILADYFILNSKFEGFPNVLAESILLGCYPLSADCMSGPREILSNFNLTNYQIPITMTKSFNLGQLYPQSNDSTGINKYLLELLSTIDSKLNKDDIDLFILKLKYLGERKWKEIL